MASHVEEISREQLVADFKVVVADAEALLKLTAEHGGEELAQVRARAGESLRAARLRLEDAGSALLGKSREAAGMADDYVHEFPWKAMGIAAGAGLMIGLLTGRR